jgi:hypothetical protein
MSVNTDRSGLARMAEVLLVDCAISGVGRTRNYFLYGEEFISYDLAADKVVISQADQLKVATLSPFIRRPQLFLVSRCSSDVLRQYPAGTDAGRRSVWYKQRTDLHGDRAAY